MAEIGEKERQTRVTIIEVHGQRRQRPLLLFIQPQTDPDRVIAMSMGQPSQVIANCPCLADERGVGRQFSNLLRLCDLRAARVMAVTTGQGGKRSVDVPKLAVPVPAST